jgi:hypothetical protein
MNALVQKAIEWALGQLSGAMGGQLSSQYNINAAELVQLVRTDPKAALQKLAPLMERLRAEDPAQFGQVEAMYKQYAPLLGQVPGKKQ